MCVFVCVYVNGIHIQNLSYRCHRIILQSFFSPSTMWGQGIEIRSPPGLAIKAFIHWDIWTDISDLKQFRKYCFSSYVGHLHLSFIVSSMQSCILLHHIQSAFLRGDWLSFHYNNKHPWNRLVFITPTELWV